MCALGLVLMAALTACQSKPPPQPASPPQPLPLKFQARSYDDGAKFSLEGTDINLSLTMALNLVDVPEAPGAPNADEWTNMRRFLRQNLYDGQEPADYAKGVIDSYKVKYGAETQKVKEKPDLASPSMNWEYTETIETATLPGSITVISRTCYEFLGGAHGKTTKNYFVAGGTSPEPLKLDYFIQDGTNSAPLNALVMAELRNRKGLAGSAPLTEGGYLVDTVTTSENFFVTTSGIGFHWDQYEIAPYSEGPIEITVPYSALGDILTPQGRELF